MERSTTRRFVVAGALVVLPALLAAARAAPASTPTRAAGRVAGAAERTVWDSVYTAEQAIRGQAAYNRTCARCHQPTLGAMHERIRTSMPTDDPGTYGRAHIADVMAYVLKVNGFPAGAVELPKEAEALLEIRFVASKP